VSQGDGAALWIRFVNINTQLNHAAYRLCGKGLIQFDQVNIVEGHSCLMHKSIVRLFIR
jgi:hypothetical protein